MNEEDLISSQLGRILRLGGLVSRVGFSFLGQQVLSYVLSDEKTRARRTDKVILNATRIVETLGKLRGAPMKLGQMLSLHENLLPPEARPILALLQKTAPAVPKDKIFETIGVELGEKRSLIKELDPLPFAAASIGQVHGAVLHDGRRIALKVQYPGIDEVVRKDMSNVRILLSSLISLFVDADPTPIVDEMQDRLAEELDYEMEAANMKRMARLMARNAGIIIPSVIDELSTKRVLAMDRVDGIPADEACTERYPDELRSRWGVGLFTMFVSQLFRHRFVHADPNLGNFAFLEDGRVIVYDYGCMKEVPEHISFSYAALVRLALKQDVEAIPGILKKMGIKKTDDSPLPLSLIEPFYNVVRQPFETDGEYTFSNDTHIYEQILDLWRTNLSESLDTEFPKDIVFIDRTIMGLFGNLCRLRARANWRAILLSELSPELSTAFFV